jgi:hypothetical protein
LRLFVVDLGAAESAYVCRRVDRLLAVRAFEDVEILGRTVKYEPIIHAQAPSGEWDRVKSGEDYSKDGISLRDLQVTEGF